MIAPEILDEIRARVPLVDLIGATVPLRRAGREHVGLCPFHHERTPSFTVSPKGFYHCFGCGAHGDAIAWAMRADGLDFRTAVDRLRQGAGIAGTALTGEEAEQVRAERERRRVAQESEDRRRRERAQEIWRGVVPIGGTPAERYLLSRGIAPAGLLSGRWPDALGWSADASFEPDGRPRPALVAAVNHHATGLVCAVQRIFLREDGRPVIGRDGKKVKLSLGDIRGNAAKLGAVPSDNSRWGVAEGVENALSAEILFRLPVYAAISSSNLPNVRPPAWARHAVVFADNDRNGVGLTKAGLAIETLRTYAQLETAKVWAADTVGADANDVLRGRRGARAA